VVGERWTLDADRLGHRVGQGAGDVQRGLRHPLSVVTILTGVTLGLGTRWGVFRYPWVTAKLALVVSVMVVGGAVIGPALNRTLAGGDGEGALIAAAGWDVLALGLATGLSVFKPGGRFRRAGSPGVTDAATAG
jgi:hypothetical protein